MDPHLMFPYLQPVNLAVDAAVAALLDGDLDVAEELPHAGEERHDGVAGGEGDGGDLVEGGHGVTHVDLHHAWHVGRVGGVHLD